MRNRLSAAETRPGSFSVIEAPAHVVEDPADDARLRNETDDAHCLATPAQQGVGLVGVPDEMLCSCDVATIRTLPLFDLAKRGV